MTTQLVQEFIEPHTFIMINVLWEPPNIYYTMPVVAYCLFDTVDFDVVHGAN